MGIGDKLQKLIIEKHTNVNELSIKANVSPNTLYSIIKRDNTKADIDVLIRISRELGVPVETFSDEVLNSHQMILTQHEQQYIYKYRQLNETNQEDVDDFVNMKLEKQKRLEEKEDCLKLG